MNKYSRVRRYGKRRFRYNYENHTLEWVGEGNVVVDSVGLSIAHWEEAPQNWVEEYSRQIDEEIRWLMR